LQLNTPLVAIRMSEFGKTTIMGLDGQDIPPLNVGESPLMLSQIAADISIDKPAGGLM
jgi:hypothetical protein|tara:strand:+ start:145 stop:318 length:174 start_codon:yes stop_codon:yes gene_type:complete